MCVLCQNFSTGRKTTEKWKVGAAGHMEQGEADDNGYIYPHHIASNFPLWLA